MTLVILTGIPGSGSSTIINKTLEQVDYLHLNYGDVMTQIAIDKNLVENRDQIRKLSPETQKDIQKQAVRRRYRLNAYRRRDCVGNIRQSVSVSGTGIQKIFGRSLFTAYGVHR